MVGYLLSHKDQEKIEKDKNHRLHHTQVTAQLIEVIMTTTTEGSGTLDDPVRIITRYFNKDGSLICAIDPCQN